MKARRISISKDLLENEDAETIARFIRALHARDLPLYISLQPYPRDYIGEEGRLIFLARALGAEDVYRVVSGFLLGIDTPFLLKP